MPCANPRTVVKAEVAVTLAVGTPTTPHGRAKVEMEVLAPWDWVPDNSGIDIQ